MLKVFYTKKGEKGIKVTVKAELILEKTVQLDGHKVTTKCCEIFKDVEAEGFGSQGDWINNRSRVIDGVEYPATIGKLLLTAENLKIVEDVFESVDNDPILIKHRQEIADKEKTYDDEMQKDMQTKKANGFCFKCHSYCYGDCGAN